MASGIGILWSWVKRSKFLPDGGEINDRFLEPLVAPLRAAVRFASEAGEVTRTPEADEMWREIYPRLSASPQVCGANRPGRASELSGWQ